MDEERVAKVRLNEASKAISSHQAMGWELVGQSAATLGKVVLRFRKKRADPALAPPRPDL